MINASKTQILSMQPCPGTQHTINLGGVLAEEVDSFKYLGSSFTATGQSKDEISGRIGLARSAFAHLKSTLWFRREISLKTKGGIYEALIWTILLYGCETWSVRVKDIRWLEVFDNDCLQGLFRYCRRDRVPCVSVRQRCSLRVLPSVLLQRLLRWFGHASRRALGKIIR